MEECVVRNSECDWNAVCGGRRRSRRRLNGINTYQLQISGALSRLFFLRSLSPSTALPSVLEDVEFKATDENHETGESIKRFAYCYAPSNILTDLSGLMSGVYCNTVRLYLLTSPDLGLDNPPSVRRPPGENSCACRSVMQGAVFSLDSVSPIKRREGRRTSSPEVETPRGATASRSQVLKETPEVLSGATLQDEESPLEVPSGAFLQEEGSPDDASKQHPEEVSYPLSKNSSDGSLSSPQCLHRSTQISSCRSYPSPGQRVFKNPAIGSPLMWLWLVLSAFLLHLPVEGKYLEGELKTAEKWAFLARFCFLSSDGTFAFDIEYDIEYATEKLLLYYDSPHQWPAVYKSDKTCLEREAVMKRENNQFINLTLFSVSSECEIIRASGDKATYHCKGSRSFRSVRERWWFIAVSNCDSTKGLQLKYKITMTNGYDYWSKHFSADEFYILRTDLIAMVLELGILFLSLLATAELKSRQLFHTTYRLYLAGVVLQVLGLIFLNLHYAKYGYNGVGLPESKLMGKLLLSVTNILMVLMLLLMGKGFNITRGRLRQASAVRLTTFVCIFCITYATLFIYEQKIFDPGEVLYLYESPAGYGLVILRCLAWIMFLYACFFTVKHYPEKYRFYYPFFFFYTLWFVSGPVVIIISNHVIDKWVREKVVNAVELSITILGHAFFLFLTRPSAANKNFPYHVKTSQITALENSTSGVLGNNTLDAFSAHPYSPDFVEPKNHTKPDLFLVSGAVEMRPIQPPRSIIKDDKSFPHYKPTAPPSVLQGEASPV